MALTIQNLGVGQLDTSEGDLLSIDGGGIVPASKSALVKNISLVNTHTIAVTVDIYYLKNSGSIRYICPKALAIPPGGMVVLDNEVTMAASDKLRGKASVANKIDYVISGMLRDV